MHVTFNSQPFLANLLSDVGETFGHQYVMYLHGKLMSAFNQARSKFKFAQDVKSVMDNEGEEAASTKQKVTTNLYDSHGFHKAIFDYDLRKQTEADDLDYYLQQYIDNEEAHPVYFILLTNNY
jgi:hypothetical protein